MEQKKIAELTDEELLQEAKKMKSSAMINAVLIGFLIGILIFSIVKSGIGFFTLIPLFLVYKFINKSKYDEKELKNVLKERNLK
ncbi:MAG: FUSC family protein [Ignavibacteriales bacterium]|nr:FUSC family protein [Ignavibacteriales bacterium]